MKYMSQADHKRQTRILGEPRRTNTTNNDSPILWLDGKSFNSRIVWLITPGNSSILTFVAKRQVASTTRQYLGPIPFIQPEETPVTGAHKVITTYYANLVWFGLQHKLDFIYKVTGEISLHTFIPQLRNQELPKTLNISIYVLITDIHFCKCSLQLFLRYNNDVV